MGAKAVTDLRIRTFEPMLPNDPTRQGLQMRQSLAETRCALHNADDFSVSRLDYVEERRPPSRLGRVGWCATHNQLPD
jgi:hypothetical protein